MVEHFLRRNVEAITNPDRPPGCLSVQGGLAAGPDGADVSALLARERRRGEEALRDRFQRAADEGDLGPDVDPGDLARYVMALLAGLAVQAGAGATRDDLSRAVDLALRCLLAAL